MIYLKTNFRVILVTKISNVIILVCISYKHRCFISIYLTAHVKVSLRYVLCDTNR